MINLADNELLIRCACHSVEHHALLVHEPADSRGNNLKGEEDDWYLCVALNDRGFWHRLRKGICYIVAPRRLKCGMYAELVLTNADAGWIAKFITERLAK